MAHISFWFMPLMLTYWVEAYILQGKTQDALVVATKEIGLEVNDWKTKYVAQAVPWLRR
jgi:hypothetical protein